MMSKPLHTNASPFTDNPKIVPERDIPMSVPGTFTVGVAGDIVITRPFSQLDDPNVQAAIDPLRSSDFAVGNLEQTIADHRTFQGSPYGVTAFQIMADPSVATDLAAMGFSTLGRANNRLSDFGDPGNIETDAHLRAAGITPVGYGSHLAAARAPAYHDTTHGRIGAVSVTSLVNHAMDIVFGASARIAMSNGRPGANSLRVGRTIKLPEKGWTVLRDFVLEHDYAFPGMAPVSPTIIVHEDRFRIGNDWYVKSEEPGYSYSINPDDLRDVLRNVRNAALYSNFTVFFMHGHQWSIDPKAPKGGIAGETDDPPDYLIEMAHEAIDAGADMFCMTGPFEFRAVEIYKGKPIFYGLGSFSRQAYMQEVLPWEAYRAHQFGSVSFPRVNPHATEISDAEQLYSRIPAHPAKYFRGATARCTFVDSRLSEITLHPIDLGIDGPAANLGIPRSVRGQEAHSILTMIAERCAVFGTKVEILDSIGRIKVTK